MSFVILCPYPNLKYRYSYYVPDDKLSSLLLGGKKIYIYIKLK